MKFFHRTLVGLLTLLALALAAFSIYLQLNGERLAEENLTRVFKRPVHVGKAHVRFPLGLGLYDCEVEGILKSRTINIQLRLPVVFDRQLLVAKLSLVDPLIFVARNKDAQFTIAVLVSSVNPPAVPAARPLEPSSASDKQSPPIRGFFVDHLEIRNGKIYYVDETLEKDYKIRLEQLNLKATDVSYPFKSVRSQARFSVVILGEGIAFSGSKVQGEGWVNLAEKDMNAKIDAERGSREARPNAEKWLMVNLVSEKNDMTVEGKVDINQIIKTDHDAKDASLQDFVFGALQSSGLRLGLGFMFKTKMDAFKKPDSVSLSGDVRQEDSPRESHTLEENLKKIEEQLESLGSGQPDNINAVAPVPAENVPVQPAGNQAAAEGTLAQ